MLFIWGIKLSGAVMAKTALERDKKLARKDLESRAREKAKLVARQASVAARTRQDAAPRYTKKELEELRRRDGLINQYMPYAASIANRVCQSLSSAVDYEEVLCNARLGLLEAAKRYDDTQDVDFRTFAYYRIKGAIYDGLRRSGWLPRTLYAKIKFEEAANEYLQNKSLNSTHEKKPVAKEDTEDNAVAETVNSLASIYIISLDASEDTDVEDEGAVDVEHRAEFMQIRRHMRDAIGTLPDKEKQLIMMYYFQNRTLEEVGAKLGLSKSWTSRLHARALSLLFKRIRNRAVGSENEDDEGASEE
jgi:RNA polymerase sigma factor for flagellar operon FliA